jgi:hypothetical protein
LDRWRRHDCLSQGGKKCTKQTVREKFLGYEEKYWNSFGCHIDDGSFVMKLDNIHVCRFLHLIPTTW